MNLYQDSSKPSASKRNLAVAGVMLVIFLFAIDATIVSTSMPTALSPGSAGSSYIAGFFRFTC
jgi:hypothetical protein